MKNRKVIHDNWKTPDYLLDQVRELFGEFYDPCPLNYNVDGLDYKISWKQVNFINPPYNLKDKTAFVKRAIFEASQGKTCILLLPVATETSVFMELWNAAHGVNFLHKRVCFEGYNSKGEFVKDKTGQSGSMIIILKGSRSFSDPEVKLILHK